MIETIVEWLELFGEYIYHPPNTVQLLTIGVLALLASFLSKKVKVWLSDGMEKIKSTPFIERSKQAIRHIIFPTLYTLFLALAVVAFNNIPFVENYNIITITIQLTIAWAFIRFFSSYINRPVIARWMALIIWGYLLLSVTGLFDGLLVQMDNVGFELGERRITILHVFKTVILLSVLLWLSMLTSRAIEMRLRNVEHFSPSLRVLVSKITRITLIAIAVLFALDAVGIDLTALAVFGGAIGVGLGFGLQKVVSNFISGIILLLDRSIKPGDVIKVEDTYGWVNSLNARFVSVITRDGKEHLIPNELLITERVENWSFSNKNVRIKIPVGISYSADVERALEILREVADESPRVLKHPKPNALMRGFGDSSIDLELRCWIDDPPNGLGNIQSELLVTIWKKFKEDAIEIPFPQRDVYIKQMPERD